MRRRLVNVLFCLGLALGVWLLLQYPIEAPTDSVHRQDAKIESKIALPKARVIQTPSVQNPFAFLESHAENLESIRLPTKTIIHNDPKAFSRYFSKLVETVEEKNLRISFFMMEMAMDELPRERAELLITGLLKKKVVRPNQINRNKSYALELVRNRWGTLKEDSPILNQVIELVRSEKDLSVAREGLLLLRRQGSFANQKIVAILSSRSEEELRLLNDSQSAE